MHEKNENVLILYNSIPYLLKYFNRERVTGSLVLKDISFPLKVIRKITRWLKLSQKYWFDSWKYDIHSVDTVIIFAPLNELEILSFLKKSNKNIRIIYWYWNPVFRIRKIDISLLKEVEMWSFDSADCKKYGMKFNTTFYFKEIKIPTSKIIFDAVFVGNDKGRGTYLKELENSLNTMGLRTYFHIIQNEKSIDKTNIKKIPYSQYLELVSKSRVIVDIIPEGQSGLTIRPMESIFLQKKLITTDVEITKQDFYHKQNIFIIGEDDESYLQEFIYSPYFPIAKDTILQYDFDGWLRRFNQ